jgi:hypothetical protein
MLGVIAPHFLPIVIGTEEAYVIKEEKEKIGVQIALGL